MRWLLPLSLVLLAACGEGKDDTAEPDGDGDGYGASEDCDDSDDAIHPDATERCDGQDNDCDGEVDEEGAEGSTTFYADLDGDSYGDDTNTILICDMPEGYVGAGYDCDDGDAASYPGAPETCDGADNDCDGEIDEDTTDAPTWYADADGDGYGDEDDTAEACEVPSGYVGEAGDCDDADGEIHPGADELCNGLDDDCDRETDEDDAVDAPTWYADTDGDGYGDAAATTAACTQPSGYLDEATDCDDTSDGVHPGADEYCNEVDDDCDGDTDEAGAVDAPTWYPDADADGYGDASGGILACDQPSGTLTDASDCDDGDAAIHPGATEICDGADNDCDGASDATGLVTLDGVANYSAIWEALLMASSGSTVRVCDGTYTENLASSIDVTLISQNGPASTILDADGLGSALYVQGGALTLSGFTLTGGTGSATASSSDLIGGAMVVDATDPVLIDDCAFQSNTAVNGGALAVTEGAAVTISGSTFTDNVATYSGGAVYADNADLALSSVLLESNSAAYSGGALYVEGGTLDLDATTIQDNTASGGGGLAVALECEATASADTLVSGNSADSMGGGLVLIWATSWSGGAFEGNTAGDSGGAIMSLGTASFPQSLASFSCTGNSAGTVGGCLHAVDEVTLTGATVSDNEAGWGGGFFLDSSAFTILSSSVTANTASHLGGGAYVESGSSLQSTSTDWGSGSDENDPDDVYLESAATPFSYGAGATFTCTDASGTCS